MTSADTLTAPDAEKSGKAPVRTSHPIAFWFLFWGEFAERSSYYGMKGILLFYMIERLGFTPSAASGWMNYFKTACFALPLLGGYVADNYFGKFRTIAAFSLPYILGHVIIGFETIPCLIVSLALLAMGAGVIKPNISTLMGMTYDQQRPGQTQLRSDAFAMFYVAINTGMFASTLAVPLIRNAYGYRVAFLFPAGLMFIAFLLFILGKPFYAKETIRRVRVTPEERRVQWLVLRRIFGLFAIVVFFWSMLEQYDNTWVLFTKDHIDLYLFDFAPGSWQAGLVNFVQDRFHVALAGHPLKADQFQVLNPIGIMVLVPLVTIGWRLLARAGVHLRPTDKMSIGFLLTLATPLVLTIAAARAGESGSVSVWWLVLAYFLITLAEVCISVTGLELAFTAAPASMKSFITACWLLAMACGDFLNAQIAPLYGTPLKLFGSIHQITPTIYFGFFTLMMIPVAIAFVAIARRFNNMPVGHDEEDQNRSISEVNA